MVSLLSFLQVLSPFYIFQVFSCSLWFADEYYYYAGTIVFISIVSIIATIYETRKVRLLLRCCHMLDFIGGMFQCKVLTRSFKHGACSQVEFLEYYWLYSSVWHFKRVEEVVMLLYRDIQHEWKRPKGTVTLSKILE